MDMPSEPPASPEQVIEHKLQVIEHKLVACGLNRKGFTVTYEAELQSIEVVIAKEAGATANHFRCINDAVSLEIVTFEESDLFGDYIEFTNELHRPMMLQSAREKLSKLGLLEGFPSRLAFPSEKLFAEAVEAHCGLEKGSALYVFGDGLIFQPTPDTIGAFDKFLEKYACLFPAIQYATAKGDFKKFGLIGNEAPAQSDEN